VDLEAPPPLSPEIDHKMLEKLKIWDPKDGAPSPLFKIFGSATARGITYV
jgi:hypothetical protein